MVLARSKKTSDHRIFWLSRVVWLLVALESVFVTLVAIPRMVGRIQIVCVEEACTDNMALRPINAAFLTTHAIPIARYALVVSILAVVGSLVFWIMAWLILRRGQGWIAYLVSLSLMLIGGQFFVQSDLPGQFGRFLSATHNYLLFVTLILAFYLFPNGRFVPRWSRWVAVALFITEFFYSYFPNAPFSPHNIYRPIEMIVWLGALLLIPFIQIYRYVTVSTPTERQQTKWVVAGLSVMIAGVVVVVWLIGDPPPALAPANRVIANLLLPLSLLALPVSLAVAVLRYQLWQIDVIVRRTLVYTLLTATLALVYFGSVTLLQILFSTVTAQQSPIAIVLSTLAIAALFNPLLRRIQQIIDRRFFRRKYDAQQTLAQFAHVVRDEVDLEAISAELLTTIESTMQPAQVSLWLRKDRSQ